MYELPPFVPNDYLFKKFASPGKENWEIFAEAVRQVMSKASGVPTSDAHQLDKIKYQVQLGFK
jgi:hypothetical protein